MENIRIPWKDWKVVRQLGKGSYGTVYEIERNVAGLTDRVALKVISIPPDEQLIKSYLSEGYDEESIRKKCEYYLQDTLNEYKLMRSLGGSANIVYCEDIAYLPKDNQIGFDVFIRMELLTSFQDFIREAEITEKDIIKLGKDICKALVLCEERGIVHRDIKPGNIFVSDNGDFKLGDFGVARILDHATNATRIGTEKFMAPEIIKQEKYGSNVDLYSLGLVLYWLLNGRRMPFLNADRVPTAQEEQEALSRRLSGDTLPVPKNGNKTLQEIILKACAYDQEKRYASAKEMLEALIFSSTKTHATNKIIISSVSQRPKDQFDNSGNMTAGNSWSNACGTFSPDFLNNTSNEKRNKDYVSAIHSFFINDSIQCTEIDVPVTIYEPDDQINRIDVNDENRSEAIHSITTEQLPLNYYVIKDKDKSTLILILKNTTPYSLNYIFGNTVFYSNGEVLPHFKVETIDHGYNFDYFGPGQVAILSETVVSNIDSFTPRIELFINQFPRQDLKIVAYGMDEKWLYFSIFNQSGWECCPIVTVLSYDGDDLVAAYQGYSVWGSNVGSGEFIKSNIEKGIVRVPKPNVNYDSISVYLSSVVYNIDSLINEDSVRILSLEGSSSPISLINLNNDLFENDYWFDRPCDIDTVKLIGDTLFFQDDLPNHEKRSHKGRITRFRHKLSILN